MKVLIVCSATHKDFKFELHQPFIHEQIEAVKKQDPNIHFDKFFITKGGIKGYMNAAWGLRKTVKKGNYDIIHAHYAHSGLIAIVQRRKPVICTFHGSDINVFSNRLLAVLVQLFSNKLIFVSERLFSLSIVRSKTKSSIIPCGIDTDIFKPQDKTKARELMKLDPKKKYILFSSSFSNQIKNYRLLAESVKHLKKESLEVIELKNYSRFEVSLLMNGVDACVLTSFSEGSPQFIKEAMACNCPIVSTDVGDVRSVIAGSTNNYITAQDPGELANLIETVLQKNERTNGQQFISHFDNSQIAKKLVGIYKKTCESYGSN